MGIEYECCHCREVFPAESRIDGYAQGYRVGFLCPRCGRNIKDDFVFSKQRLSDCQKRWLNRLGWLFMLVFLSSFFEQTIHVVGHDVDLFVLVLGIFILMALLVVIFVPCTRKAGVFLTEPVEDE